MSETQKVSLKFLAAARIRAIPPISIFSIISCSLPPAATVSSKGYKSTMTKSICGISNSSRAAWSSATSWRFNIPPKTLGWRVLTLPPRIDGYPVTSSTAMTSHPKLRINFSVPPVEYKVTSNLFNSWMIGANPVLSKTEMRADEICFLLIYFFLINQLLLGLMGLNNLK